MSTPPPDTSSMQEDAPAGADRKRRRRRPVLLVPAAVLLVAGALYAVLDGDGRQRDEGALATSCRGALAGGELATLLDSDRLRAEPRTDAARETGWVDRCVIEGRGGDSGVVELNIGWAGKAHGALSGLGRAGYAGDAVAAVPLGHGWSGAVLAGGPTADAAVLLPCRGSDRSLLIGVSAALPDRGSPFRDPDTIGALARVTTGTAERAAKKLGCEASPGGTVTSLAPPPLDRADSVPLGRATGTCRALAPTASARGRAALETELGDAPIEDCFVTDTRGKRLYHLGAFYGPYARDLRADPPGEQRFTSPSGIDGRTGDAWATAQCRGFFGTARFTLTAATDRERPKATGDTERRERQEMLKAFARDAARRHGCSGLNTPSQEGSGGHGMEEHL
ncbi:hypothetical protein [Streptomyces sp. SAJ15]|uniref:hypothetical protein n=1 Tax=Streptomyces sp. SAJ15 TaxID=2011095 RepID=UPI001184A82E|nr:hypothetical protein [Streptomyces sp. SAJ15]TVL88622.1 hypothetical protein CD790_30290 [Streptomyces sp. SAJ15]